MKAERIARKKFLNLKNSLNKVSSYENDPQDSNITESENSELITEGIDDKHADSTKSS